MLTLGEALRDDFDVVVAAPDHSPGRAMLHRAAALGLGIKTLGQTASEQRDWLSGMQDGLLHVHAGIGWEGHDLVRHGKAAGMTVVRTEHLPYLLTSPVQQAAYRAMLKSVDGRIAVSRAVEASFRNKGDGRLAVVRNGTAPQQPRASRPETRAALGISDDNKLLLTVARLSPQKGHAVLVEAAPAVLSKYPNARFVLVGTGAGEIDLRQQIEAAGLSDSFFLLGQRNDVADLLAAADLFVLPSLFEGLPLVLLEAMAAKLPAVVTAVEGSIEALGTDHPYSAPAGDAAGLAERIVVALDSPNDAAAAAQAAFQRHAETFSAKHMAADTANFYQSILHKRGARG